MPDDEWEGWVNAEAYLFARGIERVTVTECDDSERILHPEIVRM